MKQPMQVTLVSQDPVYARLLSQNLERWQYQVELRIIGLFQNDAKEAMAPPRPGRLLILDPGWFDPTREELYQVLSWFSRSCRTPVVLLVDRSWPENWRMLFGAHRVLEKPFAMEEMLAAIRNVVQASTGPAG